ncbi:MAG: Mur ligase family protein [Pirellulales bacterium]
MEIRKVLTLRGPNIWGLNTVFEAWLDQRDWAGRDLDARVWSQKLTEFCIAVHGDCDAGCARDAGWSPLHEETDVPRILGRATLELQRALGARVSALATAPMNEPGVFQVVVGYEDERLGRMCLELAGQFVLSVVEGTAFDMAAGWRQLRLNAAACRLPSATAAVLNAAAMRNIPVLKTSDPEVWQLGWGSKLHRFQGALTDRTSAVSESLLRDPNVTWRLLQAAGVPMFDPDEPVPAADHHVLVANQRCVCTVRQESGEDGVIRYREIDEPLDAELALQLVEGARMLGLDVAEFALAGPDLTRPLDAKTRGVVSVASRPNLEKFCSLSTGTAHRVGHAIMDGLYPTTPSTSPSTSSQAGRIPVISITGVNGKTTTTRLCAHIVATSGKRTGFTCTDGIYIAGRRIDVEDCSGPRSARNVLMNPTVEAAVLETARGGILREGLAFDQSDVAVVTNIGEGDHLGLNGIDTKEQLARVKRTIVDAVSPAGAAVLKADDPLTAAMADHCRGSIIYFCRDPEHPVMAEHRAKNGRVVFVRDNSVVVADGQLEIPLLSFDRIPLTHNGRILFQVENVLAATAATWALGIPAEVIRNGLESFSASLDKSPGRFNLVEIGGATVVVDYGHNTSSLKAMLDTLAQFPHTRRLTVYSAAGDRRDCDMIDQGAMLGDAFDQVILYEDHYIRGRQPGEITALFQQGLQRGKRVQEVSPVQGWEAAVEVVLRRMQPGDLVLLQADTIDGAVEVMKKYLAIDAAAREVNLKDAIKTSQPTGRV